MKKLFCFFGKKTFSALLSVIMFATVFAPAGYAVDASYDRSSESLQEVMELFDKEYRDVKSVRYIDSEILTCSSNHSRSSQSTQSTSVRLLFDDNLVIDLVDSVVSGFSKFESISEIDQQIFCIDDMAQVISTVEEIADLGEGYSITYSEEFDEDYWRLTWEKSYNGVINPYESVNAVINRRNMELVTYKRFCEAPATYLPTISEDDGLNSVYEFLGINELCEDSVTCETVFAKSNIDAVTSKVTGFYGEVYIAYRYGLYDDLVYVYVDATSGEVIGYSESRDAAKAFSVDDRNQTVNPQFANPYDQTDDASECFSALGYNVLPATVSSGDMKNEITAYLNRSDAYAFYIACHGVCTQNPASSMLYHKVTNGYDDDYMWWMYANEISGNWKFVFLDACSSAKYTTFSDAFNIYNTSSNRAFLGWTNDVLGANCDLFTGFFFPEVIDGVHSDNIRDAAVWAASQVPGSGTTPIRFVGDRTYNGVVS